MKKSLSEYIRGDYRFTAASCCIAYITQSIAINYAPLLFITFNDSFGIPISKVTILIATSFIVQLSVDFLSAIVIDRLGIRSCMIFAHIISATGFICLGILPDIFSDAFLSIIVACILYSGGSGLIEVLTSPIIESCPLGNKSSAMSFMHSFFCWGTVLVIGISTLFFCVFGEDNWRILSCVWAIIPLVNIFFLIFVPLPESNDNEASMSLGNFIKSPLFWATATIMLCGGATCHAVSQWASAFVESSIGITKTVGDIVGPCLFATLMGIARIIHAKVSDKIHTTSYMFFCSVLCVFSYLMISFVRAPLVSIAGCALCGFACGVFWPGTFSLVAENFHCAKASLFALLSLAGDIGCTLGPCIVGFVASSFGNNLSTGIISAAIFPLVMTFLLFFMNKKTNYPQY